MICLMAAVREERQALLGLAAVPVGDDDVARRPSQEPLSEPLTR